MSGKASYVAAAFNARPFGMPIPPNWFGIAAFALLGSFLNPGFFLIGAGLECAYLWLLSRSPRFRAVVDAGTLERSSWHARYEALATRLDASSRRAQDEFEAEAAEVAALLERSGAAGGQVAGVTQMAWLHLRLLAARGAFAEIVRGAAEDREILDAREAELATRLAGDGPGDDLRRSLEQQLALIRSRREAHADAERRGELVDAELARLRQQLALVREQALLAADESSLGASLDVLSASLNEANRWLRDQHEMLGGLVGPLDEAPPPELLQRSRPGAKRARRKTMREDA